MKLGPLVFATQVLVMLSTPALAAPPPGTAQASQGLGSSARGVVDVTCDGAGAEFAPGPHRFSIESAGGTLEVFESWLNDTRILPDDGTHTGFTISSDQVRRDVTVPPGRVDVSWDARGSGALLGHKPAAPRHPVSIAFTGHGLGFDARGASISRKVEDAPEMYRDGLQESMVILGGWGRPTDVVSSPLDVRGDIDLLLKHAHVAFAGQDVQLPDYKATSVDGIDAARIRHIHFFHAHLVLQDARFRTQPGEIQPFCETLGARVHGSFTAYGARGRLEAVGKNLSFDRKELSLEGTFVVRETPPPGDPENDRADRVDVAASGEFTAAGLDFAAVAGTPGTWDSATAALWTAGGALGLVAFWKLAGALFTRLRQTLLLNNETRRRVFDAIQGNPGVRLPDLLRIASVHASSARYHLYVLERHGQIVRRKVLGTQRFLAPSSPSRASPRRVLLESEPRFRDLLDALAAGPTGAASIVGPLSLRWGMSRQGAWKIINAAARQDLVVKETNGRSVTLRLGS